MKEFHAFAEIPKEVPASFITLIPKGKNLQDLSDYKHICLIGCMYKIISKTLANRLKKVVDKLVSKNQTTFIPGRQIYDSILVVNYIVDLAKREKRDCMILKVDF